MHEAWTEQRACPFGQMHFPFDRSNKTIFWAGLGSWIQADPPWLCGTITSPNQTLAKGKGYLCPADQGQYCTPAVGDPNYGNTGFDNLGEAALLMIQVLFLPLQQQISAFSSLPAFSYVSSSSAQSFCIPLQTLSYESWEYNMWNNIDAEYQYASIYYILFILAGPFVLINVFIAGISSVFLQLRRKNQVSQYPTKQIANIPDDAMILKYPRSKWHAFGRGDTWKAKRVGWGPLMCLRLRTASQITERWLTCMQHLRCLPAEPWMEWDSI